MMVEAITLLKIGLTVVGGVVVFLTDYLMNRAWLGGLFRDEFDERSPFTDEVSFSVAPLVAVAGLLAAATVGFDGLVAVVGLGAVVNGGVYVASARLHRV